MEKKEMSNQVEMNDDQVKESMKKVDEKIKKKEEIWTRRVYLKCRIWREERRVGIDQVVVDDREQNASRQIFDDNNLRCSFVRLVSTTKNELFEETKRERVDDWFVCW